MAGKRENLHIGHLLMSTYCFSDKKNEGFHPKSTRRPGGFLRHGPGHNEPSKCPGFDTKTEVPIGINAGIQSIGTTQPSPYAP